MTDDQKLEAYIRELLEVPAPIVEVVNIQSQIDAIRVSLEVAETLQDFWANPEKYENDCPF